MQQIPAVFSMRYVSKLYGRKYEDEERFKEWMLQSQAMHMLEFNLG